MTARRADHLARLLGLLLGAGLVLALVQLASAAPPDYHLDPVVAADHADRAAPPDPPPGEITASIRPAPTPQHSPPSLLDRARRSAVLMLSGAAGGIVLFAIGKLLGWVRARKAWLRRGFVGNAAQVVYAIATIAGGAVAIGGTWDMAMIAVGGALVSGRIWVTDPDTAKAVPAPPKTAAIGGAA